jgi:hypothetical protein
MVRCVCVVVYIVDHCCLLFAAGACFKDTRNASSTGICYAQRLMSAQRIRASCAMGYAQRFKEGYAQRLMRAQRIRAILLAEAWSRSMLLPKGSRQNLR